jgi:hypothetical protein
MKGFPTYLLQKGNQEVLENDGDFPSDRLARIILQLAAFSQFPLIQVQTKLSLSDITSDFASRPLYCSKFSHRHLFIQNAQEYLRPCSKVYFHVSVPSGSLDIATRSKHKYKI